MRWKPEMLYALLVYADQSSWWELGEKKAAARRATTIHRWQAALAEIAAADPAMTPIELDSARAARVVRVREGERIVTDGPFAETKELIGGAFLVELPDLDEAIRLAALIPAAEYGSIEIRPVTRH
jgi:hypothetical protein